MRIINTYSFKGGEEFLKQKHPKELREVFDTIKGLDAILCLTKESKEKTKKGQVLFSPVDMNNYLKLVFYQTGWTLKSQEGRKRKFVEPRHAFGKGRFREMDGIKNKVGLEIQFEQYRYPGICNKYRTYRRRKNKMPNLARFVQGKSKGSHSKNQITKI